MQPMKKYSELDGLRGVLSLVVVAGHMEEWLVPWYWGCMEVFYCLSGFLIGGICLRNTLDRDFFSRYFLRRILRIWPAYYAALGFCLLFQYALTQVAPTPAQWSPGRGVIQSLFFVQNTELWSHRGEPVSSERAGYPAHFDHSWSVALEEQFYLIAPFICLFCRKQTLTRSVGVLLGLVLVSLTLRCAGFHFWLLPARFDGFAAGLILAILWEHRARRPCIEAGLSRVAKVGLPISVLMLSVLQLTEERRFPGWEYSMIFVVGILIFAFFSACLIAFLLIGAGGDSTRFFRHPSLQWLGKISYSTYLWHPIVIWYLEFFFPRTRLGDTVPLWAVAIPLILGVSIVSYILIERPFLNLKTKVLLRS